MLRRLGYAWPHWRPNERRSATFLTNSYFYGRQKGRVVLRSRLVAVEPEVTQSILVYGTSGAHRMRSTCCSQALYRLNKSIVRNVHIDGAATVSMCQSSRNSAICR